MQTNTTWRHTNTHRYTDKHFVYKGTQRNCSHGHSTCIIQLATYIYILYISIIYVHVYVITHLRLYLYTCMYML